MSKMGQELDRRLDENKYKMLEVCEKAREAMSNEWLYQTGQFCRPQSTYPPQGSVHGSLVEAMEDIRQVLAKIEG